MEMRECIHKIQIQVSNMKIYRKENDDLDEDYRQFFSVVKAIIDEWAKTGDKKDE